MHCEGGENIWLILKLINIAKINGLTAGRKSNISWKMDRGVDADGSGELSAFILIERWRYSWWRSVGL